MEHDRKTFFREHDDPEVNGFVVIEVGRDQYRIAEKWLRSDDDPTWVSYWVPAAQLQSRLRDGLCEKAGKLSDEQFEAVCENTDERALEA